MRQKNLIGKIRHDISLGKVKEPFKASNFSYLERSPCFLAKHAIGNSGNYSEYFVRVERGLYKLK